MKTRSVILSLSLCWLLTVPVYAGSGQPLGFDFFGNKVELTVDASFRVPFGNDLSPAALESFASSLTHSDHAALLKGLEQTRHRLHLDDWLYYQLIRQTAQQVSPKAENYYRYTLYKWFLLSQSGYSATLKVNKERSKLLFYVQTKDSIYNIPFYTRDDKQFVCLNYHDYGSNINFGAETFDELLVAEGNLDFTYKITSLPELSPEAYEEKDIRFSYYQDNYHFRIKLNPQVKTIFANYPVVDYASYFNIPMSRETYTSLIPLLQSNVKGLSVKKGVDYLMRFTRYAFMFSPDASHFGGEKRLSPEQTLLYNESDCDDRAALFFYLVKEIYNLPMIVLVYPQHVTIAVRFDKPVGTPVVYKGEKYSVCEPTPQKADLGMGKLLPSLKKQPFEVVYAYTPQK